MLEGKKQMCRFVLTFSFCCLDGVFEECVDGHGADTSGDGGNYGGFFFGAFEVDIAAE